MSAGTVRRDSFRKLADRIRAIPGRDFGLRLFTVEIVQETWTGSEIGQGTRSTAETTIAGYDGQPPKVRKLNSEQLALAGYDRATFRIGPITPAFPGGGTEIATLTSSAIAQNVEVHVRLTGGEWPDGARFRVVNTTFDRALRHMLDVQRIADGGT